jgi:hypothetical protein
MYEPLITCPLHDIGPLRGGALEQNSRPVAFGFCVERRPGRVDLLLCNSARHECVKIISQKLIKNKGGTHNSRYYSPVYLEVRREAVIKSR